MAKLPGVKNLDVKDLDDNKERFVESINDFMSSTYLALNRGLTVQDNLVAQVDELVLYISDSSNPYPTGFAWKFPNAKPIGCSIVYADCTDGTEKVSSALFPRWAFVNGQIVIKGIRGVFTTNNQYLIRFFTFGG